MKKLVFLLLAFCFLLTGCSVLSAKPEAELVLQEATGVDVTAAAEPTPEFNVLPDAPVSTEEPAFAIYPLPDYTLENLSDSIVSVSLENGDAYVDDTGMMQMTLIIYSYDMYDMVDISLLKVGDILVTHAGEVELLTLERSEDGSLVINGGLDAGGFELVTDGYGVFYEQGYNDAKNWYAIGEATLPVSEDFTCLDHSDLDRGEIRYYPGSFLTGEVTDYNFNPHNTTVRVENGRIVEMYRVYVP